MKSMSGILGIILILIGVVTLAYEGVTYTKHEKVAQIGNVQVTADTQKTIYISPVLGAVSLAAGLVLIVLSRRTKP